MKHAAFLLRVKAGLIFPLSSTYYLTENFYPLKARDEPMNERLAMAIQLRAEKSCNNQMNN